MSAEDYAFQVSINLPPSQQYAKGHMINIRAKDVSEFLNHLTALQDDEVAQNIAGAIGTVMAAANAAGLVVADAPAQTQQARPAQQARPQGQPQQGGGGPAPTCQHGERKWVAPKGKTWKGWFCPLPQEVPQSEKCPPEFVK